MENMIPNSIDDYVVIRAEYSKDFERKILSYLNLGYIFLGEFKYEKEGNSNIYLREMIKLKGDENEQNHRL